MLLKLLKLLVRELYFVFHCLRKHHLVPRSFVMNFKMVVVFQVDVVRRGTTPTQDLRSAIGKDLPVLNINQTIKLKIKG